jgi:hypothetical protein
MLEYLDARAAERSLLPHYQVDLQCYYGRVDICSFLRFIAPPRLWLQGGNLAVCNYQTQRWENVSMGVTLIPPTEGEQLTAYQLPGNQLATYLNRVIFAEHSLQEARSLVAAYSLMDMNYLRRGLAVLLDDGTIVIYRHYHHGWQELYRVQHQAVEMAVSCDALVFVAASGEVSFAAMRELPTLQWQKLRSEFTPWLRQ